MLPVGRKRKHNTGLPERVYLSHGAYYFVDRNNKWHRLGVNYFDAITEYARINTLPTIRNMNGIMDRYIREVIPAKAPRTQNDNLREIQLLKKVFGHMRPDEILPQDIYAYMDARKAPIRANREKALLSHVYSYAIRWGMADTNPCKLVKRNPEKPSDDYIEDAKYQAVYAVMPPVIQVAMDIALLTGLRQGDILRLKRSDIRPDGLLVRTNKTGRRLLFAMTDELSEVLSRSLSTAVASVWIIHTRQGQPYTGSGFRSIWQRHIRKSAVRFAFKDIRAKTGSESADDNLLGHQDRTVLYRHYKRKPLKVTPLR